MLDLFYNAIAAAVGSFAGLSLYYLMHEKRSKEETQEETPRELVGDFDTRQELIKLSNPDEA